jgi:putative SOS response-associated peptidase YedK
MCGRFTMLSAGHEIAEYLNLVEEPAVEPRYNIAPFQTVPVVRTEVDGRRAVPMRWGLVPSWAKDDSIAKHTLNARSETVAEKPAFRAAFRKRRCLIPASGFYEWQTIERKKLPYLMRPRSSSLFAFAGLWESWRGADEEALETFTILTTPANTVVRPYHERMPVVIDPTDFDFWLTPGPAKGEELLRLFRPMPAGELTAERVSTKVNSVRNEFDFLTPHRWLF